MVYINILIKHILNKLCIITSVIKTMYNYNILYHYINDKFNFFKKHKINLITVYPIINKI